MNTLRKLLMGAGLLIEGVAHAGTVTYVYTDPQGTPLAEADASGNITATFDYAPYGSQALGSPPSGPGYTGHVNDPDTGLVYMQARYYDPQVGRFISTDPVGPSAGNGFNFNRYDYANNNPIVNMDPDGRCVGSLFCDDTPGRVGGSFIDSMKTAAIGYATKAIKGAVNVMVNGIKDAVKEDMQAHTYSASAGASGTVAVPLGVPFVSPAVGVTMSANASISSHGQFALNGSIGPVVGDGGGLAGGPTMGVGVTQGGAATPGFQPIVITNHAEADFGGVPDVPINVGLGVDWNKDGFNASSGTARGSFGVIMFIGVGKQLNFSYVKE